MGKRNQGGVTISTRAQGMIEQVMRRRVADHPGETWLKWKDEEYPWREVLSNVQRVANGLLELGVRPSDRVAILMGNRPEFLWTHFAILFIGALSVPVNISQRGPTLRHILRDSSAQAVVVADELREALLAVKDGLPGLRHTVVVDGKPGDGIDWDFARLMDAPDREPEVALEEPTGGVGMMYTSGTTGPPKGVVATRYDLAPLQVLLQASGVRPGETMYTPLRRPDDADNPVRVVLSAGCPPDRWQEFQDRFAVRIIEWFGMVDAPGILLNTEGRVGAMGKAVAGVEFGVVDAQDRPVPPGTVGELVFRHPKGQLTYYENQPDATAEAYRGGWFHSGDLAECDEDGFFHYRGRKTESMRRLGENISAWEIETVANQHPAVLESAAHAVRSELGEDEVKLVVVPRPGERPTPEEILDFCRGRTARYAIPRYVEFVEELPKGETQRIQYGVLKQRGVTPGTWDREAAGYRVERA